MATPTIQDSMVRLDDKEILTRFVKLAKRATSKGCPRGQYEQVMSNR